MLAMSGNESPNDGWLSQTVDKPSTSTRQSSRSWRQRESAEEMRAGMKKGEA